MKKILLITGASRGIGAAIAQLAASAGYGIGINYYKEKERAQNLVDSINDAGGDAIAIQADIGNENAIKHLFQIMDDHFGRLDALINNAGITGGLAKISNVTNEQLQRVLNTNVIGTILCTREAVRRMSTKQNGQGGVIVNISSTAARTGCANEWVHYAASKGAVNSFTQGAARELASEGIRVNTIAPGFIATDIHVDANPERLKNFLHEIPLGRIGKPEEIAEAALWLLSDASTYVNGAILEIGGGR